MISMIVLMQSAYVAIKGAGWYRIYLRLLLHRKKVKEIFNFLPGKYTIDLAM